jgi:DNA-binding CsgD family transcriptional regulator
LVLHFSGGLLFGSEVERPVWLKVERKREYRPRPRKKGAPRREEVERLLVESEMSYEEIGREMGTKRMTVAKEAMLIYRKRGVGGREELKEKMRVGVKTMA